MKFIQCPPLSCKCRLTASPDLLSIGTLRSPARLSRLEASLNDVLVLAMTELDSGEEEDRPDTDGGVTSEA